METELFQGPCGSYYSSKKVQILVARGGAYISNKLYYSETNKAFDVNIGIPEDFQRTGEIPYLRIDPQYVKNRLELIVGPGNEIFEALYNEYKKYWEDAKLDMMHSGRPLLHSKHIHQLIYAEVCRILCDPIKINEMNMAEIEHQMKESYKAGMCKEKNRLREILGL